jgi:A/G-specific adenine glycosylase
MQENFSSSLISWYQKHLRKLPWRETRDPYKIWLSEIILQQTRVAQGLPYYEKFVEKYPTVFDLAKAPQDEVLRLWQGLGYYSRARNLHACAQQVVEIHNGEFPQEYNSLQSLKGIGKYTGAAIASFAFKKQVPVVDGNVFRVLARYFNIDLNIADAKNFKTFFETAEALIPEDLPDLFNQGMMELGATICTPSNPACLVCPIATGCVARKKGLQRTLPVKEKKIKISKRFFYYLVWEKNNELAMKKRGPKDIWEGLFDFDLIERDEQINEEEIRDLITELNPNSTVNSISVPIKHILTHQRIEAIFVEIMTEEIQGHDTNKLHFYSFSQIEELPKPILVNKYLKGRIN